MTRASQRVRVTLKGMPLPRPHQHACGHSDRCHLEYYAKTTDCRECRNVRFNQQVSVDAGNDQP